MREPDWWLERKREKFQGYDTEVVRFWVEFVDSLADVVAEDGCVDFSDPECIDAYVGPQQALIRLDAANRKIVIECAELAHPPRSLCHKTIRIVDGLGDMSACAVAGAKTAPECGTLIAMGMFELRKGHIFN